MHITCSINNATYWVLWMSFYMEMTTRKDTLCLRPNWSLSLGMTYHQGGKKTLAQGLCPSSPQEDTLPTHEGRDHHVILGKLQAKIAYFTSYGSDDKCCAMYGM